MIKLEQVEKQYDLKRSATMDKPVVSIVDMGGPSPMLAATSVGKLYQMIEQQVAMTNEPNTRHTITSDRGTLTSHFPAGFIPPNAMDQPYIQDGLAEVARLKEDMKQFDPATHYLVVVPDLSNFQYGVRSRARR
jgi:hypothetical protein